MFGFLTVTGHLVVLTVPFYSVFLVVAMGMFFGMVAITFLLRFLGILFFFT